MGIIEQLEIRKALVDEIEADLVVPRKGNTAEERDAALVKEKEDTKETEEKQLPAG